MVSLNKINGVTVKTKCNRKRLLENVSEKEVVVYGIWEKKKVTPNFLNLLQNTYELGVAEGIEYINSRMSKKYVHKKEYNKYKKLLDKLSKNKCESKSNLKIVNTELIGGEFIIKPKKSRSLKKKNYIQVLRQDQLEVWSPKYHA